MPYDPSKYPMTEPKETIVSSGETYYYHSSHRALRDARREGKKMKRDGYRYTLLNAVNGYHVYIRDSD